VTSKLDKGMFDLQGGDVVIRHRLSTRLWHWINFAAMLILLGSGLMIFNAHPRLYWGQYGANNDASWLQIGATRDNRGFLRVGERMFDTTGYVGRWTDTGGVARNRAFPAWATIPSTYNLALARRWHLTFAWLFAGGIVLYGFWSLVNGHLWRDLLPKARELGPRHILADIWHHATLNFPRGAAALDYNILQKAAYLAVLVILIPGMILSGLTMSPSMDATWPWLLDLFGGRQSARSIHFLFAAGLVAFFVIHILMVILAGPLNEVRSMITGRFRLPKEKRR
jgi:thiosulfate reductase cytochrome b subunit